MDNSIIPYLAGITLLIGLAFGIYQYFRTRAAERHHERSATAKANHEPYAAPKGDSNDSAATGRSHSP